jgi:demethylmenaquinone methyltransferase/2-methoxy-6-polyprenyl-1,4-benzoquinol methylase
MGISKKRRWVMFNQIATTYDFINRLITFGMDIGWRNHMLQCLPSSCPQLLDMASGTMDVAIAAAKQRPDIQRIVALDMAQDMLSVGEKKCAQYKLNRVKKIVADVHDMPFDNEVFTAATVSFGIRNFDQLSCAFNETYRVLTPGGHLIILESCQPKNTLLRALNRVYLMTWVRLMGILFSKNGDSYGYLAKSIQTFYSSNELKDMLIMAGFKTVKIRYFMAQSVQLIHATK